VCAAHVHECACSCLSAYLCPCTRVRVCSVYVRVCSVCVRTCSVCVCAWACVCAQVCALAHSCCWWIESVPEKRACPRTTELNLFCFARDQLHPSALQSYAGYVVLQAKEMEILCFMNGMDPMTSNCLQARHGKCLDFHARSGGVCCVLWYPRGPTKIRPFACHSLVAARAMK